MWVEAILAKSDLEKTTGDLCPLKINLGEDGHVVLSDPRGLELVPEVGLRMTITVELHWPILGIQIPVSVRGATLEVKPEILKKTGADHLAFKLHLDDVDISILPAFLDRGIVDRINKELEAKHVELSWNFIDALSHVFDLPEALASARAIDLRAGWGSVKITGEAVVLAVSFDAGVVPYDGTSRRAPAPLARIPVLPEAGRRSMQRESIRSLWRRSPANFSLVVGAALLMGIGISALVLGRRSRTLADPLRGLLRA